MRIRIRHETRYAYATPAKAIIQMLRLTPRSHDGQHIVDWRVDVDVDCRLVRRDDAFGNVCHMFTAQGALDAVSVVVTGEIESFDTFGIVRGAAERFPPELYMRDTPLTHACAALRDFAAAEGARGKPPIDALHDLMGALHAAIAFDPAATASTTTAAEAFAQKRGVCQDFAHIFVACARSLGFPARFVSGYFLRDDVVDQAAGHAWAEVHIADLGWVGFDPANCICPREGHARVAAGPDYLHAAPVRGAFTGGAGETMSVAVRVAQTGGVTQSQSQSQS